MPVYTNFMISCIRGSWLQEIFFCKEMESVEKQTDLGQDRENRIGALGDQFRHICFGNAVAR